MERPGSMVLLDIRNLRLPTFLMLRLVVQLRRLSPAGDQETQISIPIGLVWTHLLLKDIVMRVHTLLTWMSPLGASLKRTGEYILEEVKTKGT